MANYVKTTNFYVKDSLLVGNPDKIVKGSELDTEFNNIATAIASKGDFASPNLTGIPTAPTAAPGTNTSQIATCAFVLQNSVPIGAILLWSGSLLTVPSGYQLCNGLNGTPDLRDKFVVGAGTTYSVSSVGGTADQALITHNHTVHFTDPGHSHTIGYTNDGSASGSGAVEFYLDGLHKSTSTTTTGISITLDPAGTETSGVGKNLPPYYALAYIMRVSYA